MAERLIGAHVNNKIGDELIDLICSRSLGEEETGQAANELLGEFRAGYPVRKLARLIHSDDDETVKIGAWLVSELGILAAPILDEVDFLLSHPVRDARYYGIEAVLVAAPAERGALIAKAVSLIDDPDEAVRRLAVRLLARATPKQLTGALPHLPDPVAHLTRWLIGEGSDPARSPQILTRLGDPDREVRIFAAAAAARVVDRDQRALEGAARCGDSDIRIFAERELSLLRLRRPQGGV